MCVCVCVYVLGDSRKIAAGRCYVTVVTNFRLSVDHAICYGEQFVAYIFSVEVNLIKLTV